MYDIRELQGQDDDMSCMVGSLEREKGVLVDDPRWQGGVGGREGGRKGEGREGGKELSGWFWLW